MAQPLIDISPELTQMLKDVRKAARLAGRKAANHNLRKIHGEMIRPASAEFRKQVPFRRETTRYKRRKAVTTQPYIHLKRAIRTRAVGKTGNGRGVVWLTDAFHFNFLAYDTVTRTTKSGGHNRGRIPKQQWIEDWSSQKAEILLDGTIRRYNKEIYEPMASQIKRNYNPTIVFRFPNIPMRARL